MKKLIIALAIIINSSLIFATDQEADIIYYKNEKLSLSTGWGHPSPLQTYYSQNNIDYPFTMLSTANYRGHVATWEISDNRLFLKEIQIENVKYKPEEFKVKSKSDNLAYKDKVFADWFSGVIIAEVRSKKNYWKVETSYYFYVRYGEIINTQVLTKKDFDQIENMSQKDTSNSDLMEKYSMLYLNQNYISYYFRLNDKDTITFSDKGGYISGNSGLSPILLYYSNDHMKWPFNWENIEKSGAPFCTWVIKNDSLLLTKLELHTGLGFYSIDKFDVDLTDVFPEKIKDGKVFGDWISGIYVVRHGINKEDEVISGYIEFEETELTFMRFVNGICLEKYTVSKDFDFENIPADTEEGLKNILNELK